MLLLATTEVICVEEHTATALMGLPLPLAVHLSVLT